MAGKRKRPTRDELDQRLRSALERVPATVDAVPEPKPAAVQRGDTPAVRPVVETHQWTRIVSGVIAVTPPEFGVDPDELDAAANG